LNGKKHSIKTSKMNARIIQHEIDHLDGILFPDRAITELYTYTNF
jgi:peptide deformylase